MVARWTLAALMGAVALLGMAPRGAAGAEEKKNSIYVWGEVQKPGAYPWRQGMTAARAIQEAGGFTDVANRSRATLTRGDRQIVLTRDDLLDTKQKDAPTLEPGDVIRIERGTLRVEGEVRSPGEYGLEHNTVRQALIAAGGPTPMADLDAAYIARGGRVIRVDARAILTGGEGVENPRLEPGDVLHVPRAEQRVTIAGEVQRPGAYTLQPGKLERLHDLIEAAGGYTTNARLSDIRLYQATRPGQPKPEPRVINLERGGEDELVRNPVLQSGDYVYVASKRRGSRVGVNEVYQIGILVIALIGLITR